MHALSHALLPQVGWTSLILAARYGHVEVASLLLQRGADIEAKDEVRINHPLKGFFDFLHFLRFCFTFFLFLCISFFPFHPPSLSASLFLFLLLFLSLAPSPRPQIFIFLFPS